MLRDLYSAFHKNPLEINVFEFNLYFCKQRSAYKIL